MSCRSLAGWSCGVNRTSRFQNAGCTYSDFISANPMSVNSLRTCAPSLESMCFLAGYTVGAKVWMSYLLNSASFQSPLCMRRSVMSATCCFSSNPDEATSFPSGVSPTVLSVTTFSEIMP